MNMPPTNILIYQFGEVPGLSLENLTREVANAYRVNASAGGRVAVPENGFAAPRSQYSTAAFLVALARLDNKEALPDKSAAGVKDVGPGTMGARIARPGIVRLGITSKDLFVPRLNFVFGEASPESRVAVISTHRLRPEFYDREPDLDLFQTRVLKEAIHELGHVFGLAHCNSRFCIMHFSNAVGDTDMKGPGFCRECQIRLAMRGLGHEV